MSAAHHDEHRATRILARRDKVLGYLIKRVGPCRLQERRRDDPFQSLFSAIVSQQVSTKAARAIHARVMQLFPRVEHPSPRQLLRKSDAALREAGLSRAKVLAVKDLAARVLDGTVPGVTELAEMDDEAIIERLVQVRGIGRWTVEMLLIFQLGRPDVFPVGDLGVRKGYMLAFGETEMPDPQRLWEIGEAWRPYRSVASWYLWRATDSVPELLEDYSSRR
ncbi:MAG: DNA-3-methyladenine glycosylase [Gammaproteobacteria bacterium]|nr:DNA-3-methyladenine glycosylase [Gammaproteobacteria bacterium]